MRVSYCIPTHDGNPRCQQFLFDIFYALSQQSYKNFDVTISDHSETNKVRYACDEYADVLNIVYLKNKKDRGNISANTNNAMRKAKGEILKVLFSDDFILTSNLTEQLDKTFTDDVKWAVTGYAHTLNDGESHYNPKIPYYNDKLLEGVNTLSSPSILALRKDLNQFFDEEITMLMDCDMYYRLYKYHGEPAILHDYHISNREHKNQTQRTFEHLLPTEIDYLKKKHDWI